VQTIYEKNLEALKQAKSYLYDELQKIEGNDNFEVFYDETKDFYSILDLKREKWVTHPEQDSLDAKLETFKYYREYPFLYCYGIGDGFLYKELLENHKLTQLIVIDPSPELIYVALNLVDFSEDLATRRLVILPDDKMTFIKGIELFHVENAKFYAKLFKLHNFNDYYAETHFENYKTLHDTMLKAMEHVVKAFGNDISDTLVGLKHHIYNLPRMVKHPKIVELAKKKNSDLAVIVSTGPSLHKQLDLLRDYQDKITIISVDASLPILAKEGIKPDIVVSMERDEPTSKFFIETTEEDHKNIIFLCASLQHVSVFNNIKAGTTMLAMRPFPYNYYFGLDDFGYICAGMSSANMAHETALSMGFKQCTFIGQDLAYDVDGMSHSKGHVFGNDQIKDGINRLNNNVKYETITVPAYGGKGEVNTMIFWNIFKTFIEQYIEKSADIMTTYNSTEGGARIIGSIEKPFKEVLEAFAVEDLKEQIVLSTPTETEIGDSMKQIHTKISELIEDIRTTKQNIDSVFLTVAKECEKLENLGIDEAVDVFSTELTIALLEEISSVRKAILDNPFYHTFYASIAQPILVNNEFTLAKIKVQYVDNPRDNQIKALQWILEHRNWLFSFSAVLQHINDIVTEQSKEYFQCT
jgi:hypothetical protein